MSSESANPNPSSGGGPAGLRRRSGRGRTFRPRHRLSKPKVSADETAGDQDADERTAADLPVTPDSEPVTETTSTGERTAPDAPPPPPPPRGEGSRSSPRGDGPRRERSRGRRSEPRTYAAEKAEASEELPAAEAEPPTFEATGEPVSDFEASPEGYEDGAPPEEGFAEESPAREPSEAPNAPLPGTVEALAYRPASPRSIEEAVLEVKRIVDSLQRALHDMEEVLELIEDAEQQKVTDERELARLQELLRQMTQVRDRLPMVAPVARRREGYESRSGSAPAPAPATGGGHPPYGGGSGGGDDRQGGRRRRRGRGGRGGRGDGRDGGRGERGERGERGDRGDRGERSAARPAGPPEGESAPPYDAPPEPPASFEPETSYASEGDAVDRPYSPEPQPEPPRLSSPSDAGPEA